MKNNRRISSTGSSCSCKKNLKLADLFPDQICFLYYDFANYTWTAKNLAHQATRLIGLANSIVVRDRFFAINFQVHFIRARIFFCTVQQPVVHLIPSPRARWVVRASVYECVCWWVSGCAGVGVAGVPLSPPPTSYRGLNRGNESAQEIIDIGRISFHGARVKTVLPIHLEGLIRHRKRERERQLSGANETLSRGIFSPCRPHMPSFCGRALQLALHENMKMMAIDQVV